MARLLAASRTAAPARNLIYPTQRMDLRFTIVTKNAHSKRLVCLVLFNVYHKREGAIISPPSF
jgi:hypothetical protein